MNEPGGELRVHRTHREESVRDGPEGIPQPVAVRESGQALWNQSRLGLELFDERFDRVPERGLERRSRPTLPLDPLELVVAGVERAADLGLRLGLGLARKETTVDDHLAERRDHV